MLDNPSLWDTVELVHGILFDAEIPHAIVGGVAVCLHGYQRNTVDVDLLIDPADSDAIRDALEAEGFEFNAKSKEFIAPGGVQVQFVLAGDREGPGQPAVFPHPGDPRTITMIEDLPVLSLSHLIQAKLACGLGNLRRTHKDFADVVELIAVYDLDKSHASRLHKSVRSEFKALVDRVKPESSGS